MRKKGDRNGLLFLYLIRNENEQKMNASEIKDAAMPTIVARGCFLVDLKVSRDNDVTITIESEEGVVDIADCEAVNDAVLAAFDRDVEDFALTVSSAGLDQPFRILRQYRKALGSMVEVSLKGGRKLTGKLADVDEEGLWLEYSARESVEGSRKKVTVEHRDRFPFSEVNGTVPFITFE